MVKLVSSWKSYFIVILFFLLLSAGGACLFLLPQQEFSPNENRVLQTLPPPDAETVLDGSWQEKFEEFTADQFPLRNSFTAAGSIWKYATGRRDIGGAYVGHDPDGVIRLFEKPDALSPEDAAPTLALLREFTAALAADKSMLHAAILPVPAAGTVYGDALPPFAEVFDGEAFLAFAKEGLADAPCAVADPLPALRRSGEDGTAYYRTDHHWTTAGAAAAYAACCNALGLTPLPTDQVFALEQVSDGFYGTLASKVLLPSVQPDEIYRPTLDLSAVRVYIGSGFAGETLRESTLYHEEALREKDKYTYFLGGNYGFVLLENETLPEDGGTLLLLKDSFANCFVPYLTAHYRKIIMIDPRYYRGDLAVQIEEFAPDAFLALYECDNFAKDVQLRYLLQRTTTAMAATDRE